MDEQIIYVEQDVDQEDVLVDEEDTEELISVDEELSEDGSIIVENENVVTGAEREHDHLIHREYPNQHTISSITNLESMLESRPSDVITNLDIYEILSH